MSNDQQQFVDSFRNPGGELTHTGAGNAGSIGATLGHPRPVQAPNEGAHLFQERERMYDYTKGQNGNP